jgi:hypothetical protein
MRGTQIALYVPGGVMSTTSLRNLALVLIAVTVSFSSAFAHEEKHHEMRGRERAEHRENVQQRAEHRNWEHSRTREHWQHQRTRWQAEHRGQVNRPNGWDRGRKTGWGGNNVPPGQAKKNSGSVPFHPADHSGRDRRWTGNRTNANNTPQNTRSSKDPRDTKMAKVLPLGNRK